MEILNNEHEFIKACEADIKAVTSVKEITYTTGDFDVKIGNPIIENK